MTQTKKKSLAEAMTNTATGCALAWITVVMCIKTIPDPYQAASVSTILCTLWSIIRSYFVRRFFNSLEQPKEPNHGQEN